MQQVVKAPAAPLALMGAPGGFNPTVGLTLGAFGAAALSTMGYWWWQWPHPLVFLVNLLVLHVLGTAIHDASHGVAHRHRFWNAAIGHAAAWALGFVYPVFTRVHIQHHIHVNDPENDPDHFVSTGGPLWLVAVRFFYHEVYFFQRRLWRKYELLEWFLTRATQIGALVVAQQLGCLSYILGYWFVPAGIVGLLLGLFFDYLPHRPFRERDRWKNARVYPSPLVNVLLLGQNYHLVHHLWPSVPWYHYQAAYRQMKPLLDERESPQTLGLLQSLPDLGGFLYDVFLGIRFHPPSGRVSSSD
ncbi:MAG: beta-carotene hydroxylase [Pseudanabaenaceae cyanobacterium]